MNFYDATIRYAEKMGFEKGLRIERQKAEADKLELARSIKDINALTNPQIAEIFHLPLEVVEKL